MTWLSRVAQFSALVWSAGCTTVATERATQRDVAPVKSILDPSPAAPPSAKASAVAAGSVEVSPSAAPPAPVLCPEDMVTVQGRYCPNYQLECLEKRKPWQCARYREPGVCKGDEVDMGYCIDRYEFPNQKGAIAVVMSSWNSARADCEARGKRLCTDAEWTLACEGPERLAFPYGYVRDSEACPIDKTSPKVNERRLFWKQTQAEEVARLDQREPSGSRTRCVSAFGVHDLTGNVDEWVVNESGRPYKSGLKGGNWGEYRNACRPTTRGHDEGFYYYQTGFRCCADLAK